MTYPTRQQAQDFWQQVVDLRRGRVQPYLEGQYIAHTQNVAKCAEVIADSCKMDSNKAYILGLLHDFGKRQKQCHTGVFHGKDGYDYFMALGYTDLARICLTHSFLSNPIDRSNYTFPAAWLDWADSLLADIEYDDYDKLIQLCDLLAEASDIVTIEERFSAIKKRYELSDGQEQKARHSALELKKYFEAKCHCDIYDLVGVRQ